MSLRVSTDLILRVSASALPISLKGETRSGATCQSANQRYVLNGHKTILLIDGLDHVMREVNLQTSVLNELPHPNEVPEGFLIILSGQPQALLSERDSCIGCSTSRRRQQAT